MNANFAPVWPPPGSIGLLSQSGALGYAILDQAPELNIRRLHLRVRGQQGRCLCQRPALLLGRGPAYERDHALPGEFRPGRQIRAPGAGKSAGASPSSPSSPAASEAGRRAASSHSAALASSDRAIETLFEQTGIIRAHSAEQLLDITRLLACQPLPAAGAWAPSPTGRSGDPARRCLRSPGPAPSGIRAGDQRQAARHPPMQAGLANPIDMIASATPEQYSRAVEIAAADPGIDALILVYLRHSCIPRPT